MISFIITFVNNFLKAVMFSVLIGVGIFVFGVLPVHLLFKLVNGDIRTKRHYYKRFLEVLEERNLWKYTFPKMSYEQIVNFLEVPEAKAKGCLMDSAMSTYANENDGGVLVLFVRKENYLNPVAMWINNCREREKDGIILFVPKSYRDYKKLYNYFYNKGKGQKEDELTNAQLKSLQYLKEQIHKAQCNSRKTLENCQKENTDITERIKSEEKENPMKFVETSPLPTKTENDYTTCVLRKKIDNLQRKILNNGCLTEREKIVWNYECEQLERLKALYSLHTQEYKLSKEDTRTLDEYGENDIL